jgi:hypothetical protein
MRAHRGGATPASDEEAIEQRGVNIRVTDVARALGVSRQTAGVVAHRTCLRRWIAPIVTAQMASSTR